MKKRFKLTFIVEFDPCRDDETQEPDETVDPLSYIKERRDSLADGIDDVLECYDFVTSFEKIEEVE